MPHGHCYFWRPEIVWLHVISDGLIALSYYAIPLILLFFMYKRKDFPFPGILAMFGAFILLCGTTHVMSIVTLWDPLYRLDGVIKAATAVVSVITTIVLVPLIPLALALKSPKELAAANQKLADANEKLKEIDRLKDNFFSNISHELRTPLTLILAPLESLLTNDYGPLSDTQRQNLEAMHNNSIRLFQMVNSILDFAKIGAKKIEVRREPVDIILLTKSITQEFQPIAKQKKVQTKFICSVEKKIVEMDRYLYERILFNLLSNAVKFTPDGGLISVSLDFNGDDASLSVSDTGIGISTENQKKLFQRFQQVEGSASRRFEGTGLGLALVKEFSLLLGGDVKVESTLGKGSTFSVKMNIPSANENTEAVVKPLEGRFQKFEIAVVEETRDVAAVNLGDKAISKILIAEDNLELAHYITSLLNEFAETKHVRDGEEALKIIKIWEPDLVVTDVMMPKLDGISVCQSIKSDAKTAHIPVILLTALTHRDALLRGWEAGANEYLFKPFHPKELITRIKLLLTYAHNNNLIQGLNRKLIIAARLAGMSEVATDILHTVGNILNSINVTGGLLLEKLSQSEMKNLVKLIDQIEKTLADSDSSMIDKSQQANLILYAHKLCDTLVHEHKEYIADVVSINGYIHNVKEIIALQQQKEEGLYGVVETVNLPELLDRIVTDSLGDVDDIQVIKDYDDVAKVTLDKVRLQQIVMNLIDNAKESLQESQQTHKKLTITAKTKDNKWFEIEVSDNGVGISPENLGKMFTFGFTTKPDRHGLTLHISALSSQKMGGALSVNSAGNDGGAIFTLKLPVEPLNADNWIQVLGRETRFTC